MSALLRKSADPERPFANLLPIVDALIRSGNEALDEGFRLNPDGWRCRLARPLDFSLIRETFDIPSNVVLSPDHDTILDRLTWCSIEGPGAHT